MILAQTLILVLIVGAQSSTGFNLQSPTAFHDVLLGMNKDPLENMNVSFPKMEMIPWNEIGNCYVAEIGSRKVNIFNMTIGDVITEYFVCYLYLIVV